MLEYDGVIANESDENTRCLALLPVMQENNPHYSQYCIHFHS